MEKASSQHSQSRSRPATSAAVVFPSFALGATFVVSVQPTSTCRSVRPVSAGVGNALRRRAGPRRRAARRADVVGVSEVVDLQAVHRHGVRLRVLEHQPQHQAGRQGAQHASLQAAPGDVDRGSRWPRRRFLANFADQRRRLSRAACGSHRGHECGVPHRIESSLEVSPRRDPGLPPLQWLLAEDVEDEELVLHRASRSEARLLVRQVLGVDFLSDSAEEGGGKELVEIGEETESGSGWVRSVFLPEWSPNNVNEIRNLPGIFPFNVLCAFSTRSFVLCSAHMLQGVHVFECIRHDTAGHLCVHARMHPLMHH